MSYEDEFDVILSNLDKKNEEISLQSSAETKLEYSVGLVHSAAKVNIVVEVELTDSNATPALGTTNKLKDPISNLYICPQGMVPAYNISGLMMREIMKTKNPASNGGEISATATNSKHTRTLFYSIDFRDYMATFPLAIPEEARNLNVKLTFKSFTDIYDGTLTNPSDVSGKVTVSIQVIQDKSLDENVGYRRYFTESIGLTSADAGKMKKVALPKFGFLDSLLIYDPDNAIENDLLIVKDEVEFPIKSLKQIEQAMSFMQNPLLGKGHASDFDPTKPNPVIYIDLVHPVDAESARSFFAQIAIDSSVTNATIYLTYEYVYLIDELMEDAEGY